MSFVTVTRKRLGLGVAVATPFAFPTFDQIKAQVQTKAGALWVNCVPKAVVYQRANDKHCIPPVAIYTAACSTESLVCNIFKLQDFAVYQEAIRQYLAHVPAWTASFADKRKWSENMAAFVSGAVDCSSVYGLFAALPVSTAYTFTTGAPKGNDAMIPGTMPYKTFLPLAWGINRGAWNAQNVDTLDPFGPFVPAQAVSFGKTLSPSTKITDIYSRGYDHTIDDAGELFRRICFLDGTRLNNKTKDLPAFWEAVAAVWTDPTLVGTRGCVNAAQGKRILMSQATGRERIGISAEYRATYSTVPAAIFTWLEQVAYLTAVGNDVLNTSVPAIVATSIPLWKTSNARYIDSGQMEIETKDMLEAMQQMAKNSASDAESMRNTAVGVVSYVPVLGQIAVLANQLMSWLAELVGYAAGWGCPHILLRRTLSDAACNYTQAQGHGVTDMQEANITAAGSAIGYDLRTGKKIPPPAPPPDLSAQISALDPKFIKYGIAALGFLFAVAIVKKVTGAKSHGISHS